MFYNKLIYAIIVIPFVYFLFASLYFRESIGKVYMSKSFWKGIAKVLTIFGNILNFLKKSFAGLTNLWKTS